MENELSPTSERDVEPSPGKVGEDLRDIHPGASIDIATLLKQAMSFHQAGRLAEAEAVYQQILKTSPCNFDALHLLGVMHYQRGNHANAIRYIDLALDTNPKTAAAHSNRGNALLALKRLDEALASYDRAIALRPDYAEAFSNRGNALLALKRLDEALASCDRSIALRSDCAEAFSNRGTVLQALKRLDGALASYDRAIALRPDYAEAFSNRGTVLQALKRLDEALASYDRAIALKPDYADGFKNRALCRFLAGQYTEGWIDYEWRWNTADFPKRPNFANWQGETVEGRHLLIFSEQGLGDIIQFARYLPLLAPYRCRLTFLTSAKLVRLLRPLTSGIEVISALGSEQNFDFQCALMSLPHRLGTDISTIPNLVPYLRADDDLIASWSKRIGEHGFKIGITWQGNPLSPVDKGRSISLNEYVELARIPSVRLISLQKGYGSDQVTKLPKDVTIETLGDAFDSGPDAFIDTAAVISTLDLVITADTAIAHLAGALGCRTWIALKYVPHWPWMLDRDDSPWYPTVRLFRQMRPDNWAPVFATIANELRLLCRRFG